MDERLESKFNKPNRGLNQRKTRKKYIANPGFLLTTLIADAEPGLYPVSEQDTSFETAHKISDQNKDYAGESIPGEFYEPDSEILKIIENKKEFTKKELSDSGICTSLRSLSKENAKERHFDNKDPQLAEIGINNLRQKYS